MSIEERSTAIPAVRSKVKLSSNVILCTAKVDSRRYIVPMSPTELDANIESVIVETYFGRQLVM